MQMPELQIHIVGEVTPGPGTTQFMVTMGPDASDDDIETMRHSLQAARDAAHLDMTAISLWEERAFR